MSAINGENRLQKLLGSVIPMGSNRTPQPSDAADSYPVYDPGGKLFFLAKRVPIMPSEPTVELAAVAERAADIPQCSNSSAKRDDTVSKADLYPRNRRGPAPPRLQNIRVVFGARTSKRDHFPS